MSTFRHILMLRFNEDTTDDKKQALFAALASLPAKIPRIRRYEFGPDLGLAGNADFALVADFDTEEDWRIYQNHPDHQVVVRDLVAPITAEAIRVQYLLG
jgi:hypothetical protein